MPRPPTISRARVAQAALDIIDDEGLDALSIERLAKALGVKGPSLYHHFIDKADILVEVSRLVFQDVSIDHPDDDWETYIVETSHSFYRAVLRHPKAVGVILEYMPYSLALRGFGKTATVLEKAGVDPSLQLLLMFGLEKLTWGWALRTAMLSQQSGRQQEWRKATTKWPALGSAAKASQWYRDDMLDQALRAYIRGVVPMGSNGTD